jgi:hypothetical protein
MRHGPQGSFESLIPLERKEPSASLMVLFAVAILVPCPEIAG